MKNKRRNVILRLIESSHIETQEELTRLLSEKGFDVTQATVSRDIKELRLIKVATGNGKTRYVAHTRPDGSSYDKLMKVFSQAYLYSDNAGNIVVIKTLPGMANAVASAIDMNNFEDVLGTIAGDDNIITICKSEEYAERLVEKFSSLAGEK